jgi:hypothetical protein
MVAASAFERSLQRLNAAVGARLTNADAVINNRVVRVAFDNGTAESMGMQVRRPTVGFAVGAAGAVTESTSVRIVDGRSYRVQLVDDDGAGWCVLHLEEVS